jgi:hypothetical protein
MGLPGIRSLGRPAMKAQARRYFHLLSFILVMLALFFLVTVSTAQGLLPLPISQAFFPFVARQPAAITPTPTLTPTPTATPTQTPTPTATPVPPSVKILSGHYAYTDREGSVHILGELENQTGSAVTNLWIDSSLKSSRNKVLESQTDMVFLSYFPAGKRTCFDIIYVDPPSGWSSYSLSSPAYSIATGAQPDLEISSLDRSYNSSNGEYTLSGNVRNDGSSYVNMVKVIGSVYDRNDKILGCAYSYITASSLSLNPGGTSSFKIEFYGRDFDNVDDDQEQPDGYVPP